MINASFHINYNERKWQACTICGGEQKFKHENILKTISSVAQMKLDVYIVLDLMILRDVFLCPLPHSLQNENRSHKFFVVAKT